METDPTQPGLEGVKHPTIAELRDPASQPHVHEHLASCSMCQSVVQADADGATSAPIELDLPKGLVSENAFKWPADPIARGGMAQIFAAEDRRLSRTVILKAPRDGDDLSPGMTQLFQRRVTTEARILAKLQHPSIVTIYELGKASVGFPFCVLERVEGTALRDRLDELAALEQDGTPRTRERLELLSNLVAIAEALAYAHERKIVHRDCTPNNIILGKRGEATLIDWGIARDLEAPGDSDASLNDQPPSMSGRMVTISAGTPPYLPLEQSQGRAAAPSFDVYSFGMTLYEVVSGNTPFAWKTVETAKARNKQLDDFLDWLKHGDAPPPAMPKDPELSGIIAKAITRDPAARFTADELVRALKQYLTGDLVFSHRYSATGRLARWARRHKATTVSLAFLVAFAIVGALVWAQLQRAAKEEAELRAMASAANADAAEKGRAADEATRAADEANARAEEAQRKGQNADELRREAEAKRKAAEQMRNSADAAARSAKGQADDALKRFQEAMKVKEEAEKASAAARMAQAVAEKERDNALIVRAEAEKERDTALALRAAADKDRDSANTARAAAEADREAARQGQSRAEQDRDAARGAQAAAERERDAATAARATVERERDDARRRVAELEQRLRELQNNPPPQPGPPGPPPPPPGP
ncbi:MAG: protein kinase [Myxococcales bacterium]|nr:protein kinase [Myxococcales bacterium]